MKIFNLEEYKEYLTNFYVHEYDNNEDKRKLRKLLLESCYSDQFLSEVIDGTYLFVEKILSLTEHNYYGYLDIPLEEEPKEILISLNLSGGWMSDTIIKDSNGNTYSLTLLKMIFGNFFYIEPGKEEDDEFFLDDGELEIMSCIPSYSLYIQCEKEILDEVRVNFSSTKKLIKVKDD